MEGLQTEATTSTQVHINRVLMKVVTKGTEREGGGEVFERYAFRTDWPQWCVRMLRVRDWVLF